VRPRAPRMGLRWPRMGRAACRPCFPFSDSSPSCELPTSWRSGRPRRATLQSCRPLRRLRASGHRRPWRSLGCGPAGIAAWCAPLERKSAHGPTRGTGVLSEDAAATRRSGTAVATAAWVDYLERLAERMRLQLMRAELARAMCLAILFRASISPLASTSGRRGTRVDIPGGGEGGHG